MADDDHIKRPESTKGKRLPEEEDFAPPQPGDDELEDDEDGSLTKMEMELQEDMAAAEDPPEDDGDKPQAGQAKPGNDKAAAPAKPGDAATDRSVAEKGLEDDTVTGALLLYALYRAAQSLGKGNSNSDALSGSLQKIKDTVAFYTGNKSEGVKLLPEENGMRVAVDKEGRPVWASITDAKNGDKSLIFDWRKDGGLSINIEGPSGFEGRIASRGKIEIAEGGKSLKSSDGTWLATSNDGNVDQWIGELELKPGKSRLEWNATIPERSHPLSQTPERKAQSAIVDSKFTAALDGMTMSKDAAENFTFRERAQLRDLYQGLMKGSLPDMEKALKNICQSSQSESRTAQVLNYFIDSAGLKGKMEVQQKTHTRLVFSDGSGNLLGISGAPGEASYAQRGEDGSKIPTNDPFLELVRSERAARSLAVERAEALAKGNLAEFEKADLARRSLAGAAARHFELAAPQRAMLHDLSAAFSAGDMEGVKRMIQTFDSKPNELEPIVKAFSQDMKRFSKDFDGSFTIVKGVDRQYAIFTFGDSKNQIAITTEQGSKPHVVSDNEPGLRRSAAQIGTDLAGKVVKDAVAMQLELVPEVRTPMTGTTNSHGLWSPDYIDSLPKDTLNELQNRISSEYGLGGHEQMRDFAIRAGQTVSNWERTQKATFERQVEEERTQSNMERAKESFIKVRDEVLKAIGLDKLPEAMTLDHLQTSSSSLIDFLGSAEAKAAGITATRNKVKAVQEFQVARHQEGDLVEKLATARIRYDSMVEDFLKETRGHQFPDGLTAKQITVDPPMLKEYFSHPDATTSGITDLQTKRQIIDDYLQARVDENKYRNDVYEPAKKQYHEIRDEILTRLGADKIPSGMTSTALKASAETVRDLLKMQGKELGIKDLEVKLATTERMIEAQQKFESARAKVNEIFETRKFQFERLANEMARDMGLPPVKLEVVTWDKNAHGDYLDGRIRINRSHLLNSSETSVAGTVYHELIHAEQQYKMCRYLADEFYNQNGRQPTAKELGNAWNQHVGGSMTENYANSVLQTRSDRPLSAAETKMASELVIAWHKNGAVGTNYDKSVDAYYKLFRAGEDVAGFYGNNSTETLLDAFAKRSTVKSIAAILPGAEFQTGEGKAKCDAILKELVRDRTAFLNGESKVWDKDAARQKMFDAIIARRQAINDWREAEWASYGGPDKKHEYDAQVGGLFFERQAQEHRAKPPELRVLDEIMHGQKKNWLPENITKNTDKNSTTFRFDNAAEIRTSQGTAKVKGVELKNGTVSVICEDGNGSATSNKAMADLVLETIKSRAGTVKSFGSSEDVYKAVEANPQLKAELVARYLQDIRTSAVASYYQASQLGEQKTVIPEPLRGAQVGWQDLHTYMRDRLPDNLPYPEDLIHKELQSLQALGSEKLNKTVEAYKAVLRDRLGREGDTLAQELATGKIPLNMPVPEYLAQAGARFEKQVQQFGKPANYEQQSAIFEALGLNGKDREQAVKRAQERWPDNKEVWEKILPQANPEALERQRQYIRESLKERGFTDARLDPARKFNVFDLEKVLRFSSTPRDTTTGDTGNRYKPLPFTDVERTIVSTRGHDIDLSAAHRAESIISRARELMQKGLIYSNHQLESLVASDYLNSALENGRLSSVGDLLLGGSRAINPHSGDLYSVPNTITLADPAYREKLDAMMQGKDVHTTKAMIDGKEVALSNLSRTSANAESSLAFKGIHDLADKARVERRKELLFTEIQTLSKEESNPARLKQITRRVAELEWLSIHSADYWQGSAELAQMRSRALLDAAGIESGRFKNGLNPTMEALTTPMSDYVAKYENMYETPMRFNPGAFSPSNEFARALQDIRTTSDKGTVEADGSLLFKLKEQRKVMIEGIEHTLVGVEERDGKTNILTTDKFGRTRPEPNLTQAYMSKLEAAFRTKPIAQSIVMNDPRTAANVLSRVLDSTPASGVEETLLHFDVKKSAARETFMQKHYFTPGSGPIEWSTIANLKGALMDRQYETFRDVVASLDSYYSESRIPGEKAITEFEIVANEFAKECKLAGLADVTKAISDKGVGEIKIKSGDLEVVLRTDNTQSATRNGKTLTTRETADAFRELGQTAADNIRRRVSKVNPPAIGSTIELPDSTWKPVKNIVLAESGGNYFVRAEGSKPVAREGRQPIIEIAEAVINQSGRYKPVVDPSDPATKLVLDSKYNKVYELGNRHPLTWQVELFERPDITAVSRGFVEQHYLKSTLEKMQETIEGGRLLKQLDQAAQTTQLQSVVGSPADTAMKNRARLYLERMVPDAGETVEQIGARAREFYIQDSSNSMEVAVRRTKVLEYAALNKGESKLLFTEGGKEFVPRSFNAEKGTFETVDGRTLELKNCRMEIRIGKGTDAQKAAREALAGFEQLRSELNTAKIATGERASRAAADVARAVFDDASKQNIEKAEAINREIVVKLGAFEVAGKNVDVFLTNNGVRIGNRDMTNLDLIASALKDKRAKAAKAANEEKQKLENEVKELEALHKDVLAGKAVEVEKMKIALAENISKEYETMRTAATTPAGKVRARAAEATGRAGAYLMIAAFVASMLTDHDKAKDMTESGYAPTRAR
ncbi:MAG: hypothetical protein DKT66_24180 [Candidatus Melainabacteria bacterium]|nr:MAG: hypothetical protein DKT66_24180 [Candidatus Melainabacteria bacterium]